MLDKIQYEKALKKIEIIQSIIYGLIDYNNITNYDNQKEFFINIDYNFNIEKNCYIYNIKINRGNLNPQNILNLRIQYKNKIDKLIYTLLDNLCNNQYFDYISYKTNPSLNDNYYITFRNNIIIGLPIKDNNDKMIYNNINSKYNKNIIKTYHNNLKLNTESKDLLQILKCIKTISLIENIFEKIGELNTIENYVNIKPYKLKVTFNKLNDYYKYNFKIIRGSINQSILLDFSVSLNNENLVNAKLEEIINKYMYSSLYLYRSTNTRLNNKIYSIHLNNLLDIEFECNRVEDAMLLDELLNINNKKDSSIKKLSLSFNE